jgi:hypothetical protein
MNNNKKKKSLHCPEVESLMNGKMPIILPGIWTTAKDLLSSQKIF